MDTSYSLLLVLVDWLWWWAIFHHVVVVVVVVFFCVVEADAAAVSCRHAHCVYMQYCDDDYY